MGYLYLYQIDTSEGMIVKMGKTVDSPEGRLEAYTNHHGLKEVDNTLVSIEVKNCTEAEAQMESYLKSNGFCYVHRKRTGPKELYQNKYEVTFLEVIELFKAFPQGGIDLSNRPKYKGCWYEAEDLVTSETFVKPLNANKDNCLFTQIILHKKDQSYYLAPKYQKDVQNAVKCQSNLANIHIISLWYACETLGLNVIDKNSNPYNFDKSIDYEKKRIEKNTMREIKNGTYDGWQRKSKEEMLNLIQNPKGTNVIHSDEAPFVYFCIQTFFQEGYSLVTK